TFWNQHRGILRTARQRAETFAGGVRGMNAKTAETFIRLHRPDRPGAEDPRIAKAVRFAESDAALRDALAKQRELDRDAREAIRAIRLPEAVRKRLAELGARPAGTKLDWRTALKQPAFLCVVIAV